MVTREKKKLEILTKNGKVKIVKTYPHFFFLGEGGRGGGGLVKYPLTNT